MYTNYYPIQGATVVITGNADFTQELYVNWDTGVSYIVTRGPVDNRAIIPQSYTPIF